MGRIPEEIVEEARRVDVVALARRFTRLRLESRKGEWSGPCPQPGCSARDDGFRVHTDGWWFCRKCHGRGHGAISLLLWLKPALSFPEAVEELTGRSFALARYSPQRSLPKPAAKCSQRTRPTDTAQWRAKNTPRVDAAHERLWSSEGEPGQTYLLRRGIQPHAWLMYRLGFLPDAALPGTNGRRCAPAIVFPWYAGDRLVAVRYRFLEKHSYVDDAAKQRSGVKQSAVYESQFQGKLYGGHVLQPGDVAQRALFIFEGELNAISAWLVAQDTHLDVLSLGSESQGVSEQALAAIKKYRAVFFWADKAEIADKLQASLPHSHRMISPDGKDANDLLIEGKLGALLSTAREWACTNDQERETLLWDLWAAAHAWQGVDAGTAQMIMRLSKRLHKPAPVRELAPDVWIAAVGIWAT